MKGAVAFGVLGVTCVTLSYVAIPRLTTVEYVAYSQQATATSSHNATSSSETVAQDARKVVTHVPLPSAVKAIYMTSCVVGTPSFRDKLVALIDETEVNAVIIDIKDYSGTISFSPASDAWKPAWNAAKCGTGDMETFIKRLHDKNIFVIGRITVFQDPFYAPSHPELAVARASDGGVWRDHKGLSFIDVGARPYWDHIITLSRDAYNIGFDELNFDYVRYPSDGNMQDIVFPQSMQSEYKSDKQANLEAFFQYLNQKLDDETLFTEVRHEGTGRASSTPYTSVDLFGMTTTNTDDLSIGQVIERAVAHFDFVAPMVYPSHYPKSFLGLGNPNDYPYKVVNYAMQGGVNRLRATTTVVAGFAHTRIGTSSPALYAKPAYSPDKLRTWIQDFDYGGDYDAIDVQNQIQASYDAGVHSWMIWAPSNIYTREALKTE